MLKAIPLPLPGPLVPHHPESPFHLPLCVPLPAPRLSPTIVPAPAAPVPCAPGAVLTWPPAAGVSEPSSEVRLGSACSRASGGCVPGRGAHAHAPHLLGRLPGSWLRAGPCSKDGAGGWPWGWGPHDHPVCCWAGDELQTARLGRRLAWGPGPGVPRRELDGSLDHPLLPTVPSWGAAGAQPELREGLGGVGVDTGPRARGLMSTTPQSKANLAVCPWTPEFGPVWGGLATALEEASEWTVCVLTDPAVSLLKGADGVRGPRSQHTGPRGISLKPQGSAAHAHALPRHPPLRLWVHPEGCGDPLQTLRLSSFQNQREGIQER